MVLLHLQGTPIESSLNNVDMQFYEEIKFNPENHTNSVFLPSVKHLLLDPSHKHIIPEKDDSSI